MVFRLLFIFLTTCDTGLSGSSLDRLPQIGVLQRAKRTVVFFLSINGYLHEVDLRKALWFCILTYSERPSLMSIKEKQKKRVWFIARENVRIEPRLRNYETGVQFTTTLEYCADKNLSPWRDAQILW